MSTIHRLSLAGVLFSVLVVRAQSPEDAAALLRKVRSFVESTRNWRAEVIETSQISGGGMNVKSEVQAKIAAQEPLKMSRQNSGDDGTVMACDGIAAYYSGDGHSYSKHEARVTPQCDLPLSKFYGLENNPTTLSFVGRDHVRLVDGDRNCVVVRAAWKRGTEDDVRTMCIDPDRLLILRDVVVSQIEGAGIRSVKTTTLRDFESNPVFPPDTFRFSVPPGAVEMKPEGQN